MPIAVILETLMIISFGISWPLNILKSYRSRTTKGKSLPFTLFILFGYICGIISKILLKNFNLAFWFYIPNIIMVSIDVCLYFRNLKLDQAADAAKR